MRAQTFLDWLYHNYNPEEASDIASNPDLRGGWEVWLQVEIGMVYIANALTHSCEREVQYPNSNQRCDFYMHDTYGQGDDTYLELKCINNQAPNPDQDAWTRFNADIDKITNISQQDNTLPCIALLAMWGTIDPNNDTNQGGGQNGHPLNWYWSGNRRAYVWDTTGALAPAQVLSLQAAQQAAQLQAQQGVVQNDRLLLYAVSIV